MTKNERLQRRDGRGALASLVPSSELKAFRKNRRAARLRKKYKTVVADTKPSNFVGTTGDTKPAADREAERFDTFLLDDGEPRRFTWDGLTATRVRITARSTVESGVTRLGGDAKGNEAVQQLLEILSIPMILGGPSMVEAVDQFAADLHAATPHCRAATGKIYSLARAHIEAGNGWLAFPPILLIGPPGLGKSHWGRELGRLAQLPTTVIDASAMTSPAPLIGIDGTWRSGRPSLPVLSMHQHRRANPIFVVDEVDKLTSLGAQRNSAPDSVLLGLLEPATARVTEDSYLRQPVNMSFINWILTANDLESVSQPIRDRCLVVHIDPISAEDFEALALRQIEARDLDPDVLPAVMRGFRTGRIKSLRKLNKLLSAAEAAMVRPMLH